MEAQEYLTQTANESFEIKKHFLENYGPRLVEAADGLAKTIRQGGKVLIFGNGGSAADAQHMAAEMIGRMLVERRPLPAVALTTDTSNITAVANDYGYEEIFLKQVQGLATSKDAVVAISTSGNSVNVLKALEYTNSLGCFSVGLTGGKGGKVAELVQVSLCAELGGNASRIQETHIFAVHSMVDLMDRFFLQDWLSEKRNT